MQDLKTQEQAEAFLTSAFDKNKNADLNDLINLDHQVIACIVASLATSKLILIPKTIKYYDDQNLDFTFLRLLQILELIITHYQDLTPKVIEILLAQNFGNFFILFRLTNIDKQQLIGFHSYDRELWTRLLEHIQSQGNNYDKHIALYLTILEKIQLQGYIKDIDRLFWEYPSREQRVTPDHFIYSEFTSKEQKDTYEHFIYKVAASQNVEVVIRLLNLLTTQVKKSDYDNATVLNISSLLISIYRKILSRSRSEKEKDLFLAYMRLLEETYRVTRDTSILDYLMLGFGNSFQFVLSSRQFAYEIACLDKPPFSKDNCSSENLSAQRLEVVAHIKSLPQEESIEAYTNATTPNHPLYKFFNLPPDDKIKQEIKQIALLYIAKKETHQFLRQEKSLSNIIRPPFDSIYKLSDPNDVIQVLSLVGGYSGGNIAFDLTLEDLTIYYKMLNALLDNKACPNKITDLLAIQEKRRGNTIAQRSHLPFIEILKRLPRENRIRLISIKNNNDNFLFANTAEQTFRDYLALLNIDLKSGDIQTAKAILAILSSRNKSGEDILDIIKPDSNGVDYRYIDFTEILCNMVKCFPELAEQVANILYDKKTKPGLNLRLNILHIWHPSHSLYDKFIYTLCAVLIKDMGLAKFIEITLNRQPLSDFLRVHYDAVYQRDHQTSYLAYSKFLEAAYFLTNSPDNRNQIFAQLDNCLRFAERKRIFFGGEKVFLSSNIVQHHQLTTLLNQKASNNLDAVKLFLEDLSSSPAKPDDIIDLLQTTSNEGQHLGIYVAGSARTEKKEKGFLGIIFQDILIEKYLKLLLKLLTERKASPEKITQLLIAKKDEQSSSLVGAVITEAPESLGLLFVLLEKLPVNYRLQIFSAPASSKLSLLLSLAAHWSNDKMLQALILLRRDLSNSTPEIATQIIDILRMRAYFGNVGLRITSSTLDNQSSLLFLQILNVIVTKFSDLIPSVLEILLERDENKRESYGTNLLQFGSEDHISLYLTILEKIQSKDYVEKINEIFSIPPHHYPTSLFVRGKSIIGYKEMIAFNQFVIKFLSSQNENNCIRMINLLENNINKTGFAVTNNSLLKPDLRHFLSALKMALPQAQSAKNLQLAYVKLLETLYAACHEREILLDLLEGVSLQAHISDKKTLTSSQLAYEIASSLATTARHWLPYFSSTHKEMVISHISSLPDDERIPVIQNIKTPSHPLQQFFNYHKDEQIRDRIDLLLTPKDTLGEKIQQFLKQETKDINAIEAFLTSLVDSEHDTNAIIETLSEVDEQGKHIAFYLITTPVINTYFRLLISLFDRQGSLLDKNGCSFKITRLLSLQDEVDRHTIGHCISDHDIFIELIKKLPLDCQILLLSITAKDGSLMLMSGRINGWYVEAIRQYLKILHTGSLSKDKEIVKTVINIISKIFTSCANYIPDVINTFFANSQSVSTAQFLFFSQLLASLKDNNKEGIDNIYITVVTHLFDLENKSPEVSYLIANELGDKRFKCHFQDNLRKFATEEKKGEILDYIKQLPKEQRMEACQNVFTFAHPLREFFCHSNDGILQVIYKLLAQDKQEASSMFAGSNFYAPGEKPELSTQRTANIDYGEEAKKIEKTVEDDSYTFEL